MAFPNVQPNQSFNTVGMKIPIDINKYNNQGHLVESYKAVPPGISNLPTGPNEGMVIESPAKMQKGGVRTKVYNDPLEFKKANEAYQDSLATYNLTQGAINSISNAWINNRQDFNQYYQASKNLPTSYKGILPTNSEMIYTASHPESGDWPIRFMVPMYKKPTKQPIYKEKPKEYIPTKTVKLEREPIELVMPQSDRTLMPYNNTMQVLRSVQQDDRDRQGPKVVKAPNFKSGGYIIGGLKNRVLYNKAKYKR